MKTLHVFGTSCMFPTANRKEIGFFLEWPLRRAKPEYIVLDPGEGTKGEFIRSGLPLASITKILVTHFHGDHVLGLPGLIQVLCHMVGDNKKTIQIFYPKQGHHFLERLLTVTAFRCTIDIEFVPVDGSLDYETDSLIIQARSLQHRIPTVGYRIQDKPFYRMFPDRLAKAGIAGKNISLLCAKKILTIDGVDHKLEDYSEVKPGTAFASVMDTVICPNAFVLAENVDLLLCESTFLAAEEELAKDYLHMTAGQAALIAKQSNVKQLALTHFSRRYANTNAFEEEAPALFPNTIVTKDGCSITFGS